MHRFLVIGALVLMGVLTGCDEAPPGIVVKPHDEVSVIKVHITAPELPAAEHKLQLNFEVVGKTSRIKAMRMRFTPDRTDDLRVIAESTLDLIEKSTDWSQFGHPYPIHIEPGSGVQIELLATVTGPGNYRFFLTNAQDMSAPEFFLPGLPFEGRSVTVE